ncbi:inositol monophosphatase [Paenibacillus sp. 7124]|uniref:Inositol-1-monophosphatase n=1 Tax=Paenibacillus apii TaxID=1850370 RepID=A0A6M1PHJ9_9BACL|nr:inositol monophosphatase family protein [Paenibacillus apii]NGM82004.1 inositol monophosphatase [Paenibacillus apii]
MNEQDLNGQLLQSAIRYAKKAGQYIREHALNMGPIEQKKNASDLVTDVDKGSEALIKRNIEQEYKDHWILSEEDTGQSNSYAALLSKGSGYGWIIDPIDGTTNFIHGIPHYAVSIGVVKDWKPILGVVYNPLTDELFYASLNLGAFRNGSPLRVGNEQTIGDALLATGFQAADWKRGSQLVQEIDRFTGSCRNVRLNGAASLELCWIAMGRLTGFWHGGLHPWDTAAGVLILSEAGGAVTTRDGTPYQLHHDTLVASNGKVHNELLELLKKE